jgi:hypothetical protein
MTLRKRLSGQKLSGEDLCAASGSLIGEIWRAATLLLLGMQHALFASSKQRTSRKPSGLLFANQNQTSTRLPEKIRPSLCTQPVD